VSAAVDIDRVDLTPQPVPGGCPVRHLVDASTFERLDAEPWARFGHVARREAEEPGVRSDAALGPVNRSSTSDHVVGVSGTCQPEEVELLEQRAPPRRRTGLTNLDRSGERPVKTIEAPRRRLDV